MKDRQDIRVLIAEDDYLAAEMINQLLGRLGYTVVGRAVDGQQAVEMTVQLAGTPTQPDVVLMDIMMPGMDGIEAARAIQERCPTPVVVLTAYEKPGLVAEASAAGVGAYLVKPPEAREMERAIIIAMARFDDMMALRQNNRRLEEALAELKAAQQQMVQQQRLAAVGQLAAGIAHEFNNLMASVILYSDMMLRVSDLSSRDRERLTTIRHQGRQAANIVQKILDFGRQAVLDRQDLDLLPYMVRLKSFLEGSLPKNIRLHLSCDAEEVTVRVDPARLQQALVNLALNAQDAMPEGGDLTLALGLCDKPVAGKPLPEGGWACLAVTDTGTGIASEVLSHIFEPFFTTRLPLRSGLGLAQVHGIVAQHGGHVEVDTTVGEGTTFTVYLPALPPSPPEALPAATAELPQGGGETVLVVEDNPVMRQALVDGLDLLNYRTLTAVDGREALALYEQHAQEIALVLSDLIMPEIGGMALCRALSKRHPEARVVILTGYPLEEGDEAMRDRCVVGWLKKPVDLDRLAEAVAQALEGS